MLFSVRCVTCNKAIGGKWERYKKLVARYTLEGHEAEKIVDSTTTVRDFKGLSSKDRRSTAEDAALRALGVNRYCCRRHFLTDIDLLSVGAGTDASATESRRSVRYMTSADRAPDEDDVYYTTAWLHAKRPQRTQALAKRQQEQEILNKRAGPPVSSEE